MRQGFSLYRWRTGNLWRPAVRLETLGPQKTCPLRMEKGRQVVPMCNLNRPDPEETLRPTQCGPVACRNSQALAVLPRLSMLPWVRAGGLPAFCQRLQYQKAGPRTGER